MHNLEDIYNQLIEEKKSIIEQIEIIDSFEAINDFLTDFKYKDKNNNEIMIVDKRENQKKTLTLKKINVTYIIYYLELINKDLYSLNHLQILYDIYNLREDHIYEGIIELINLDLNTNNISKYEFIMFILENYSLRLKKIQKEYEHPDSFSLNNNINYYQIIESFIGEYSDLKKLKILLNTINLILQTDISFSKNLKNYILDKHIDNNEELDLIFFLYNILYNNSKNGKVKKQKYLVFNALKDYIGNLKI